MLVTRPRVRTNGVYVLETSYIKKPMRDMWTEVPMHAVLEVRYLALSHSWKREKGKGRGAETRGLGS